jgi:hypothetical protein
MKISINFSPNLSLEDFAIKYLSHYFLSGVPAFHKEIYSLVSDKRLIIAAPRKFAKSTICSFFYPLWCAVTGRKKDITLLSRTGSLAEEWLRKIKNELEHNKGLQRDYGDITTKDKWTEDYIILKNGVQIRAKGVGYQIRGYHPDTVIIDDMEDDESVMSETQTEALKEWFYRALLNTLEVNDQLIVIGTIISDTAFLNELLAKSRKDEGGWTTRLYSALTADGKSIWPEKWPVEALMQRKEEIGTYRFSAEYMNEPISKTGRKFFAEWFKFYPADLHLPQDELDDSGLPKLVPRTRYMIVDPAMSETKDACPSTIVIVDVDSRWRMFVIVARRFMVSPLKLIEEIFNHQAIYKCHRIGVEQVAYQKALKDFLRKESLQREVYLPLIELKTDTRTSKEMRIEGALSPRFERGEIFMKKSQTDLQDELLRFPGGKLRDLVDALAYVPQIAIPPRIEKGAHTLGNMQDFASRNWATGY